jgi:hypothetical protein
MPDRARYAFYIEPCGREATLLQLHEAGIEIERCVH